MAKATMFSKVMFKGIMGSLYGLVSGFSLALIIFFIQWGVGYIDGTFINSAHMMNNSGPPIQLLVILGMGFGAIMGSIFGSISGIKENK